MSKDNSKTDRRALGPWIAFHADAWSKLTEPLSPELEAMLVRVLVRMIRHDEPFPADPDTARHLLRLKSITTTKRVLTQLESLGVLERVVGGFTFGFADDAQAERRVRIGRNQEIARKRVSAKIAPSSRLTRVEPAESSHLNTAEKSNEDNETKAPAAHLPHHTTPKEEESYPTQDAHLDAAREKVSENGFRVVGWGRGGAVTPEGRRKVCELLGISDATPLVRLYEAWSGSRSARDPDAKFAAAAVKIYREASLEVRQACQPMPSGESGAVTPLPPVRASSELLAKLNQGRSRRAS